LKTARHAVLIFFFLGLVALEIGHGIFRLGAIRERHERQTLADIEAGHKDLAHQVESGIEAAREHAGYLARLPAVRRLLATADSQPAWTELRDELTVYLVAFAQFDRIRVLDERGSERFRCDRIGRAAGALPSGLLQEEPDREVLAWAGDVLPGEVAMSDLVTDTRRVEVPESDRQVIHFACAVAGDAGRLGTLVLTVYASPLLNAVRRFAPLPGVRSALIGAEGVYLASADRSRENRSPDAADLERDHPEAAARILAGEERIAVDHSRFLALQVSKAKRPWRLVAAVPESALDAASGHLRGEYAWVVGSVAVTTLILIAVGAFLVRMSVREVELREAARYREKESRLERQVELSERLGSLGLLTAGVAHEINNPLEGIENYLALLDREGVAPEKRKRYVEMVRYGFHRIRDIVRDLSAFARPTVAEGSADLEAVVRRALKMVGYAKDLKHVEVELHGFDEGLVIPGDGGRLEQVFINLLLNAAKAQGGRGRILIGARRVPAGDGAPRRVEVTVDDEGPGISPENLTKVFDPFFTTTDGTGLGLSISYGIIRAHGGAITAENRPGGGARFTLSLLAEAPGPEQRAAAPAPPVADAEALDMPGAVARRSGEGSP
jgi:signal transduction histidine kinase